MDEFFDKLGAAAKRLANSAAIEVSIAAEEQKLREQYQTLGKLCFQAKRQGQPTEGPEIADCCRKIEAGLKRIRDLKQANHVAEPYAEEEDFVTVE